jgi:O-antigen ligase
VSSDPVLAASDRGRMAAWQHRWQILPVVVRLRRGLWTLTVCLLALWLPLHWPVLPPSGIRSLPLPFTLYASDISMAATLLVWCLERLLRRQPLVLGSRLVASAGALVIVASLFSIPGSLDPALSLAITAHLLVLGGFYLLCVNDTFTPAYIGWLFAALLLLQAVFGLLEAWTQNTAFLGALHLFGLVSFSAGMSGASIVGAADGGPWLRAYGTLVHPNVLGGMLLIYLGAVVERQLATGRRLWLLVIAVGVVILFLSFSRAAWIGMLAMAVTLSLTLAPGSAGRLRSIFAAAGLAFALMALAFWPIVLARIGAAPIPVDPEVRSVSERLVLLRVGFAAIGERPLFGLGAGTFTEWVARLPGRPAPIEPIHNVPLLVVAETGLPGILAWLGLGLAIARRVWRGWRRMARPQAVWTAVLIGVLVASMADHYWWTMAPMRTMFVIALALFASRTETSPLT